MRLLHCISTLGPGGAERQLSLLAPGQAALGDEIHLAYLTDGPNLQRIRGRNVRLHRIPVKGPRDPMLLWRLNNLMKEIRPDIVHTWLPQMDVAAGSVALARGIPWVMAERSCRQAYPSSSMRAASRLTLGRLARGVIANSEDGRAMWTRRWASKPATFYVPNAVAAGDIREFPGTPKESLNIDPDQPVVLIAGRLAEEKNPQFLVEVADKVCAKSSAVFLFCGEGPLEAELRQSIAKLEQAARIRLLGYRSDVWGIMKTADLFVSASLFEGQPNSVIEAVSAGCPVLVSDIPAHRSLLSETHACFSTIRSSQLFADKILHLLEVPKVARDRATTAARTLAVPDANQAARMYRTVYETLLSRL